jgi:hypothetical protein
MSIATRLTGLAGACIRRGERERQRYGNDERSIAEATFLAQLAACLQDQGRQIDAIEGYPVPASARAGLSVMTASDTMEA